MIEDDYIEHCFDIDKMRSGDFVIRPKGQLGTCGWYPKPWTCVFVKNLNNVFDKFFIANKQWLWDDFPEYAALQRKACVNTYWLRNKKM
jgi:hypothetical protein